MTSMQRVRSILAGLFMIIGGLLMINDPEDGYVVITFIMGVTLLIRGIQNIVYYFTFARHMVGGRTMRAIGIVLLDLGAFTLTLTDVPKIYVILYLLVLHLFTGVIDVMHALETKRQGSQHWRLNLAVVLLSKKGHRLNIMPLHPSRRQTAHWLSQAQEK